jgi:hypothetical protein
MRILGIIILVKIIIFGITNTIIAFIIMVVWNGLIPSIFEISQISYWQSLCISLFLWVLSLYFRNNKQ